MTAGYVPRNFQRIQRWRHVRAPPGRAGHPTALRPGPASYWPSPGYPRAPGCFGAAGRVRRVPARRSVPPERRCPGPRSAPSPRWCNRAYRQGLELKAVVATKPLFGVNVWEPSASNTSRPSLTALNDRISSAPMPPWSQPPCSLPLLRHRWRVRARRRGPRCL